MDPQAVASFYATNLPSHMNAYCSSSDSENETEKMHICGASRARECRTFSRYPGGSSMHSPVFGGSVLMVEAMEGSSPGMPEEPLEGRQRQPGHHSPMAADISSQQALPMMGTQARTTQHTPALHFRGDSGEFPAPESHPCTEKERMSDFPPPSFYRTDSIGNLVSDPQVAPISLPDRPITPIFYTDPAGNVMTDPPTPGTRKHGKSATLSEKNASRSSEWDEVNASANWHLYNNMVCDMAPDAPPVPPEEHSSSSFRKKVPVQAVFLELNPHFLGDLHAIIPDIYAHHDSAPLAILAAPVWAPVPANFWLCELCWGIWAREEMEYTQNFAAAQANYTELVPDESIECICECVDCKGITQTFVEPLHPDFATPQKKWQMYHGERFDNRGRWLFVGNVKTIVATTSSADIMRLSLMDHGMGGSPIPPIGFYRSRKIGEVLDEKRWTFISGPSMLPKLLPKEPRCHLVTLVH